LRISENQDFRRVGNSSAIQRLRPFKSFDRKFALKSPPLNLAETDLIRAPVIDLRRFNIGVSGHALRNGNVPAVFHIVSDADGG
jgi:hypothetical protein